MSRSFVSRGNFERLLAAAALVEMLHLIGLFDRRVEVDGTMLATLFTLGGPLLVLSLGFGVTRLGSSVAKWILIALVALALFSAVRLGVGPWRGNPALSAGAIAGLLQLTAVLMLFTAAGRDWTVRLEKAK